MYEQRKRNGWATRQLHTTAVRYCYVDIATWQRLLMVRKWCSHNGENHRYKCHSCTPENRFWAFDKVRSNYMQPEGI